MSIKIKIKDEISDSDELEIKEKEVDTPDTQIKLDARKTLDGKIMVMDHRDIDIVIDTEKRKIVAFPKEEMSDEVYETQDKYFDYLSKKGVIDRSSVQSGDVFASMQASYLESSDDEISAAQIVLLTTYKFIEEEKPRFETEEWLQNELDDQYTYPTEDDSTELGEVPQEPKKGSMSPYSSNYYNPARY